MTWLAKNRYIIPWALMLTAFAVSVLFAANYKDGGALFCVGVGVVDLIIVLWEVRGDKLGISGITVSRKVALIIAAVLFAVTTFVFGYFTSIKYRTYTNFAFDFGIFAQMYERMAVSFSPSTTVERSHMMSHFGVHFSPIFYLFLPGYYIFRLCCSRGLLGHLTRQLLHLTYRQRLLQTAFQRHHLLLFGHTSNSLGVAHRNKALLQCKLYLIRQIQ